jgi:hypothetical protein
MWLCYIIELAYGFEQALSRKVIGATQGFDPANNFIKCAKGIVPRNVVNDFFQATRGRQRMSLILLAKHSA